jgi:hypothetical protein
VVVVEPAANAAQPPVRAESGLGLPHLVALRGGGDEVLGAVLDPFDWTVQQHRSRRHRHFFGMEHRLGAEPAADIGSDHPHLVFGEPQRPHQHRLGAMGHLGAVPHRERRLGGIEPGHHRTRLDRVAAAFVEMEPLGNAMGRAGKGGVDVAVPNRGAGDEIVRAIEPRPRRACRNCREGIDHRRHRVDVELDQARGILRDAAAHRHHHRHGFAHMADLALGKPCGIDIEADRRRRQRQRNAIAGHQRPQVGIGEHRVDAGERPRRGSVDAPQQAVGDRTAREGGVEHAGNGDIVDETPGAAQQLVILQPHDAAPEKSRR